MSIWPCKACGQMVPIDALIFGTHLCDGRGWLDELCQFCGHKRMRHFKHGCWMWGECCPCTDFINTPAVPAIPEPPVLPITETDFINGTQEFFTTEVETMPIATPVEGGVRTSQSAQVLYWMKTHNGITQMEAIHFGCTRLAARIKDLRSSGVKIVDERIDDRGTKRYYYIGRTNA